MRVNAPRLTGCLKLLCQIVCADGESKMPVVGHTLIRSRKSVDVIWLRRMGDTEKIGKVHIRICKTRKERGSRGGDRC